MQASKRILVAPLDWGLGHASRCIPIIRALLDAKAEVILASNSSALQLLEKEFPDLETLRLPAYNVKYYFKNMALNLSLQMPRLLFSVYSEYRQLHKLIKTQKIDGVISDNRFGCFSKKVKSVFITHQVHIIFPKSVAWLAGFLHFCNHTFIRQFSECWIPDYEEESNSLSGILSHPPISAQCRYLGALSRMLPKEKDIKRDIIVVLSGPEPQRSQLEKQLIVQLQQLDKTVLFVRGKVGKQERKRITPNMEVVNFLKGKELNEAIMESELVICRSGYSSIMDLAVLGKKAFLIPTPGQTEQEYLASYFSARKIYYSQLQSELDLDKALKKIANYEPLTINKDNNLLEEAIRNFLQD